MPLHLPFNVAINTSLAPTHAFHHTCRLGELLQALLPKGRRPSVIGEMEAGKSLARAVRDDPSLLRLTPQQLAARVVVPAHVMSASDDDDSEEEDEEQQGGVEPAWAHHARLLMAAAVCEGGAYLCMPAGVAMAAAVATAGQCGLSLPAWLLPRL